MIKKQWNTGKAFTMVEQYYLKAMLNAEQDYKNNPNFDTNKYANNQSAVARGFSLRLIKLGHR
tara:strand:+ start:297 stop:485 length:189 start_codon:yes stop_codon:yes gene_type:complete